MKKQIAVLFALVVAVSSCDIINDPVLETSTNPVDTNDTNTVEKYRIVILEEYTGQKCGNCPKAQRFLYDSLVPKYGKNLLTMAVHAGSYAVPDGVPPYNTDFRTPEGDAYNNNALFGMSAAGQPNAMINRKGYPGGHVKYKFQWETEVYNQVAVPADAWLTVENTYNAATRTVSIHVKSEFLNSLSGDYKLCLAVTEDSIVSPQLDYFPVSGGSQDVLDYVHRHIFRGTVNTAFGNYIVSDPAAGQVIERDFTYTVPANFNENHCHIVAYIYADANYEIVQAAEAKVIE